MLKNNYLKNDPKVFKGKYFYGLGRRKSSVSKVRLYNGSGELYINGKKIDDQHKKIYLKALVTTNDLSKYNISVVASGGGKTGWIDSINLGVARALVEIDPNYRQILKKHGYLKRDPREVERKKPGLKKARKSPQWQKR